MSVALSKQTGGMLEWKCRGLEGESWRVPGLEGEVGKVTLNT